MGSMGRPKDAEIQKDDNWAALCKAKGWTCKIWVRRDVYALGGEHSGEQSVPNAPIPAPTYPKCQSLTPCKASVTALLAAFMRPSL